MGSPVCNYGFSLADFKILSLYLTFDIVIIMSWCESLCVYLIWDSMCFLGLNVCLFLLLG